MIPHHRWYIIGKETQDEIVFYIQRVVFCGDDDHSLSGAELRRMHSWSRYPRGVATTDIAFRSGAQQINWHPAITTTTISSVHEATFSGLFSGLHSSFIVLYAWCVLLSRMRKLASVIIQVYREDIL